MSRHIFYNPNPEKNRVGDCTVRAISKALDLDWDSAYTLLSLYGFALGNMPSANHVWGAALHDKGWVRKIIDDGGNPEYTVENFCEDHPSGTYILAIPDHVVCVKNGYYYDTWDSGKEIPDFYWEHI